MREPQVLEVVTQRMRASEQLLSLPTVLFERHPLQCSIVLARLRWEIEMARSERFELPTLGIEIRCSIQLSYERLRWLVSDLA